MASHQSRFHVAALPHTPAQLLSCSAAQLLSCSAAQLLSCSAAQLLSCSAAQLLRCSAAQLDLQVRWRLDHQRPTCAEWPCTDK